MRADLRALTDDQLVLLANRGLVKRARKLVDRGDGPRIEVDGETVRGHFDGGPTSTLPPGVALSDADCTCSARKLCVHRLATVMAYAAAATEASDGAEGEAAPPAEPPGPLDIDDALLLERLGKRVFGEARRRRKAGYPATVRFSAHPEVLLPTCTVRFLVPWELHHTRCDCAQRIDCAHVAMAVWAIAEVEARTGEHEVLLGQQGEATGAAALAAAQELALELVGQGWSGSGSSLAQRVAALRESLDRARAVWVVDALDELMEQIGGYSESASTADVLAVAHELGELAFRARVPSADPATRLRVHGEARSGSTRLDHTRLQGMGARYRLRGGRGRLEVFFQEGSPDALVMERRYPEPAPHGPELGGRRSLQTPLRVLASGSVITRAATRRPNRLVELGGGTQRMSAVTPGSGRVLLEQAVSLSVLHRQLSEARPDLLQPRLRARRVATLHWDSVDVLAWDPGRQTVWALVSEAHGRHAVIHCEWRPETPGAAAAVAQALQDGLRCITAEARLRGGRLWLEPLLLVDGQRPVVPDLAPEAPLPRLPAQSLPSSEAPLDRALVETELLLATCARLGVRHLPPPTRQRVQRQAQALQEVGLLELAEHLRGVEAGEAASWARAHTRWALLDHLAARGDAPTAAR